MKTKINPSRKITYWSNGVPMLRFTGKYLVEMFGEIGSDVEVTADVVAGVLTIRRPPTPAVETPAMMRARAEMLAALERADKTAKPADCIGIELNPKLPVGKVTVTR